MPKLKELRDRYRDQGLVLIGVHTTNGAEKMADFVKEAGIDYPVAADVEGKTVAAFAVDSFPDYYVIDRMGHLRFADLANAEVERAVQMLLAEGQEKSTPWADALADAKKRRKRVLATTLAKDQQAALAKALRGDRDLMTALNYEYVRYDLQRGEAPAPAGHPVELDAAPPALVVFDETGEKLATLGFEKLASPGGVAVAPLATFLKENARRHPDAEDHYAAALARAKAEDKRLLVHLGAPW